MKLEFVVLFKIGGFVISQYSDGAIWINEEGGEGMPVNAVKFEKLIREWYDKEFSA